MQWAHRPHMTAAHLPQASRSLRPLFKQRKLPALLARKLEIDQGQNVSSSREWWSKLRLTRLALVRLRLVAGQISARGPSVRWRGLWPLARGALYDAPTASTLTPHACSSLAAPGVHRLPCPSPVPVVVMVTCSMLAWPSSVRCLPRS